VAEPRTDVLGLLTADNAFDNSGGAANTGQHVLWQHACRLPLKVSETLCHATTGKPKLAPSILLHRV
jgi:hypothetical protein